MPEAARTTRGAGVRGLDESYPLALSPGSKRGAATMMNAMLACCSEWGGHVTTEELINRSLPCMTRCCRPVIWHTQFYPGSRKDSPACSLLRHSSPTLPRARLDIYCRRGSGKTTGSSVRIWERLLFVVALLLSRVPPCHTLPKKLAAAAVALPSRVRTPPRTKMPSSWTMTRIPRGSRPPPTPPTTSLSSATTARS